MLHSCSFVSNPGCFPRHSRRHNYPINPSTFHRFFFFRWGNRHSSHRDSTYNLASQAARRLGVGISFEEGNWSCGQTRVMESSLGEQKLVPASSLLTLRSYCPWVYTQGWVKRGSLLTPLPLPPHIHTCDWRFLGLPRSLRLKAILERELSKILSKMKGCIRNFVTCGNVPFTRQQLYLNLR
jgi:hypothetical protein